MTENTYIPKLAEITGIKEEVGGLRAVKTFRTKLRNGDGFSFGPGQCAMLSVFGKGEAMISISSSPFTEDYLQFSILKTGRVTTALHEMVPGDVIGIRGPYGNGFPLGDWKGKNLIFIGGGIGIAPIWSVLQTAMANKPDYGELSLIYGARTSGDMVFGDAFGKLKEEMPVYLSVDVEEPGWTEYVGFVPSNVADKKPSPENAIAITCGPPIMIKFVIEALKELGFGDEQIYTT
ncbi:MAG: heterodisulfide reductase subunit F, partial [bacterium]|nr:heterodisulfide reductase subunit F [bacterium]